MRKVSRASEQFTEINFHTASFNERYASEEGESGKFKPPAGVISAAKHALELIKAGKAGDGFTSVGRHRAHQLAAGEMVPLSDIKRMHSYFSRHGVDKKGKDWDNDSPGKVAWLAWGGDAGKSWAAGIVKKHGGGDSKKEAAAYDGSGDRYNMPDFYEIEQQNERYRDERETSRYLEEEQNRRSREPISHERQCGGCGADLRTKGHELDCPTLGSFDRKTF